ncbi:TIGR03620 family F420-dependent LLM class oxidoreductase [Mycobacteroides sp. LB1]|nr:TIGR03620 family F420-dependent LLM class oxidoreductase [Mycobacteroides sp. LB1]
MVTLGKYGAWSLFWRVTPKRARQIEDLGYGAIWLGGSVADLGPVRAALEATSKVVVGTSITNIFGSDPRAVGREFAELNADYPGRVALGLGIGHQEKLPGREVKPLTLMAEYLDVLDTEHVPEDQRFIAALGPKMLRLAADRTAGTLPYLAPAENTGNARSIVGDDTLVIPEHKVVLEGDRSSALARARSYIHRYWEMPNYVQNLKKYGFADADFADGGSDRLLDAVVASGTVGDIVAKLEQHFVAGANHVAIQVIESRPEKWDEEIQLYFGQGIIPNVDDGSPDELLDTFAAIITASK